MNNLSRSLVIGAVLTGLAAGAQQPAPVQPNSSFQCGNGVILKVVRCATNAGKEYCEFKMEQNGKVAFQGVSLRQDVAAGVKSCTEQAKGQPAGSNSSPRTMAEPGKSFNPPYLNEMPSLEYVKQEIQGKDPTDTLARQVAVFTKLQSVIRSFQLAGKRYDPTPDEQKISGKYSLAAYEMEQGYRKTHAPAEAEAFLHMHGRYEFDAAFDRETKLKLFSTAFLQQLVGADKTWTQDLQAHMEQERRASEQAKAGADGGSPFIRNDPGTLAARRCAELGGSEFECVGKGMWTGFMDMAGIDPGDISAIKASQPAGVVINGAYQQSSGPWLNFAPGSFTLTGCGKLVPNVHSYAIAKRGVQLTIAAGNEPSNFVLSMGSDRSLSGPGALDVKGQIITGYRRIWMQEYINGIAVAGGGYWTSEPIYADKTERCTIGTLTQAPPPPPEKNPLINEVTSMLNSVNPQGPSGLRLTGQYAGQGGLTLDFAVDGVVLDCGAAHVKQSYTVENAPSQILVNVENGASPFTLTLQPSGALAGSGSADVVGRVVTGSTQNAITYAPKTARCAIGTLTPKGTSAAQVSR